MTSSIVTSILKPLDESKAEIRLLHLQPYRGEDEISCTLHIGDLDSPTCQYEALSYEWGDPTNVSLFISIDGEKITVRENLWWALWHLRNRMPERVFWVDALCINQNNKEERNHQVSQMGRIYRRAKCVVAWIGQELNSSPSDVASKKLTDMEDAIKWLKYDFKTHHTSVQEWDPGWASFLRMCKRTYWTRLWIIQELLMARKIVIQCSDHKLDWTTFEAFFAKIESHPVKTERQSYPSIFRHIRDETEILKVLAELEELVSFKIFMQRRDRRFGEQISSVHTLFELFCAHRNAACEQLHDRLFGLLSLCRQCCQEALHIDYGTPLSDLCRNFLEHYFQHHAGPMKENIRSQSISGVQKALLMFSCSLSES